MIRLGLCSGACITRSIDGVIEAASAAKLDAVEWAADAHIAAGDLKAAENAMMATLRAGLTISSYATLYKAGAEDGDFTRFDALLDIASMLQAPMMRVYACANHGKPSATPLASVAVELIRLGDRAAKKGIRLCLSLGRGTCLDGYDSVARLAGAVEHDFIRLAWEDLPGAKSLEATAALENAGAFAGMVVARCAGRDGKPRSIAQDESAWRDRIRAFKRAEMDPKMGSFVLLGASRPEGKAGEDSLSADATALRALVAESAL